MGCRDQGCASSLGSRTPHPLLGSGLIALNCGCGARQTMRLTVSLGLAYRHRRLLSLPFFGTASSTDEETLVSEFRSR